MLGATLALGTLLSLQACPSEQYGGLSREEYIDLYVSILRAADAAPDSTAASDSALRILIERGYTEDDLLDFANRYATDAQTLADMWTEIEERLKAPPPEEEAEESEGSAEDTLRRPDRRPDRGG
ncbi:MAG TPA: hypothetical protein VLC48_03110 [Gemmatimonadota bacterium]|nr:hypothetical protein [Gemmatimonadota bacterium]